MAVAGLHNVSAFGPSFFGESRPNTRASDLVQMWRELENEHVINQSFRSRQQIRNGSDTECSTTPKSIIGQGSENGDDISRHSFESENQDEHEDNNSIISDDLGETERERVRQIFREWMSNGSKVHSSYGQISRGPEMGARRPIRRLCGRQTLLDLLMRAQTERKNELLGLAERRPVSEFVHRNRIQVALLRGRFLRNEKVVRDERPSSRGATELGLLRQRHTVSDLREGFLSKLDRCVSTTSLNSAEAESESTTSSDSKSVADGHRNVHELEAQLTEADNNTQHDEALDTEDGNESCLESEVINENYDRTTDIEFDSRDAPALVAVLREPVIEIENNNTERRSDEADDDSRDDDDLAAAIWQEGYAYDEPFDNNVEEINQESSSHIVDWPSHDLQEAIDTWLDMPSGRIDTFYPPDDDDRAHRMEIRELFSRRRVSSLLGSSFRESLDQVLQSHMERLLEGHASGDWELDNNNNNNNTSSFPALIEQDQEQQQQQQPNGADGNEWNPFVGSQQPLWDDEEFQDTNWSHHNSNTHLETEWEVINELRIDMARLQQRMNNMQSMLEACMEMQIELRRSVRQDLSAALNRPIFSRDKEDASEDNRLPDESQLDFVRKGICCVCRDSKIDSLLYRCGHMCACSKCADNLVRCKGKCPMCRAPAVEAVQAYFIQ
ncbi:E3 ubiquitin-protein ligase neurl1b [Phtheirospermum japonicum]|uniref:E3 ubiquitin-protein ligase neurl1b n=1 Tax=Phtheirospermum japonicum TaxID=374723 RepID=A0A830CTN6_9LAMI|nr:E3 ubiquitin-protein ligase neurl1b [Phtheirospermum japonicum]